MKTGRQHQAYLDRFLHFSPRGQVSDSTWPPESTKPWSHSSVGEQEDTCSIGGGASGIPWEAGQLTPGQERRALPLRPHKCTNSNCGPRQMVALSDCTNPTEALSLQSCDMVPAPEVTILGSHHHLCAGNGTHDETEKERRLGHARLTPVSPNRTCLHSCHRTRRHETAVDFDHGSLRDKFRQFGAVVCIPALRPYQQRHSDGSMNRARQNPAHQREVMTRGCWRRV